jgi:hypothetical protein
MVRPVSPTSPRNVQADSQLGSHTERSDDHP